MQTDGFAVNELSVTPDQGCYAPGETVLLTMRAVAFRTVQLKVEANFYRGLDLIEQQIKTWNLLAGPNEKPLLFQPGLDNPAGYGVEVSLTEAYSKKPLFFCETAFDVLASWTAFPRYGFVCDFSTGRKDIPQVIAALAGFHVNGLQFYDWQYRHDTLVPPQDEYTDPLGRRLSLNTVGGLINVAHAHGMKCMAYLAIYAASAAFWKSHPAWALYDREHRTIPFGENFLGIMNPVPGGPWSVHLLEECQKTLETLPFDGFHIDQYGEPKKAFDNLGQEVDLPKAFADFIEAAVSLHPDTPVLFNAVGNWPIAELAKAPTAFNYIEIWPPDTTYKDVAEIVRNARQLSGGRSVVIALYLPANRAINNRLADAMILSAGGTRIEVGENTRLLSDPYFPKHEVMDLELQERLQRQIELTIRYLDWISPLVDEISLGVSNLPDGVEYFCRQTTRGYSISLVNLQSARVLRWNEEHDQPAVLRDFSLEIQIDQPVINIWQVSPDRKTLSPIQIEYTIADDRLSVKIPILEIWDVILIETEQSLRQ